MHVATLFLTRLHWLAKQSLYNRRQITASERNNVYQVRFLTKTSSMKTEKCFRRRRFCVFTEDDLPLS